MLATPRLHHPYSHFTNQPSSTLWERKIRTDKRRLQTPSQATSSTEELRAMLNINEGTIAAFDAISTDLIK